MSGEGRGSRGVSSSFGVSAGPDFLSWEPRTSVLKGFDQPTYQPNQLIVMVHPDDN